MVTANTTLGKVAAIAMLPALTLGLFAAPADAVYYPQGTGTNVSVNNMSAAFTLNQVTSGANTGGNVVMSTSASVGGDSGNSMAVSGPVTATSDVDGDVEVDAEGDKDDDVEAKGDVKIKNTTTADNATLSTSGNGGAAGKAVTSTSLKVGDAVNETVIAGAQNHTEIDITVEDDCECDRYNEYYESASEYYESNYKDEESEYEEDGKDGDIDEKYELEEGSTVKEGDWEVYTKTYVPVKTNIVVNNNEISSTANIVDSFAVSGNNAVFTDSVSMGGTSGNSMAVSGLVSAHSGVDGDADVDAEGDEYGEVDAEGDVKIDNATHTLNTTGSATGDGGAGSDSTTETLVVIGRAANFTGIVDASKHTIIRIRR